MLSFISFVLVCIGSLNWFSIGVLQYDFVAGIFGSQSNIFSRIIYALVGIASIVVIATMIKNKGRFRISFNKANEEYSDYMAENRAKLSTESDEDKALPKDHHDSTDNKNNK